MVHYGQSLSAGAMQGVPYGLLIEAGAMQGALRAIDRGGAMQGA